MWSPPAVAVVSEQDWQKDRHLVEEAISVRERNIQYMYSILHIQIYCTTYTYRVFMFEHTCCSTVSSATEAPPPNREYMVT